MIPYHPSMLSGSLYQRYNLMHTGPGMYAEQIMPLSSTAFPTTTIFGPRGTTGRYCEPSTVYSTPTIYETASYPMGIASRDMPMGTTTTSAVTLPRLSFSPGLAPSPVEPNIITNRVGGTIYRSMEQHRPETNRPQRRKQLSTLTYTQCEIHPGDVNPDEPSGYIHFKLPDSVEVDQLLEQQQLNNNINSAETWRNSQPQQVFNNYCQQMDTYGDGVQYNNQSFDENDHLGISSSNGVARASSHPTRDYATVQTASGPRTLRKIHSRQKTVSVNKSANDAQSSIGNEPTPASAGPSVERMSNHSGSPGFGFDKPVSLHEKICKSGVSPLTLKEIQEANSRNLQLAQNVHMQDYLNNKKQTPALSKAGEVGVVGGMKIADMEEAKRVLLQLNPNFSDSDFLLDTFVNYLAGNPINIPSPVANQLKAKPETQKTVQRDSSGGRLVSIPVGGESPMLGSAGAKKQSNDTQKNNGDSNADAAVLVGELRNDKDSASGSGGKEQQMCVVRKLNVLEEYGGCGKWNVLPEGRIISIVEVRKNPDIYVVGDLLSHAECFRLIEMSSGRFAAPRVLRFQVKLDDSMTAIEVPAGYNKKNAVTSPTRSAQCCVLPSKCKVRASANEEFQEEDIVEHVLRRCSAFIKIPRIYAEQLEINKITKSESFGLHCAGNFRRGVVGVFLSDAGPPVVFPGLGIELIPKKGFAFSFPAVFPETIAEQTGMGVIDLRTGMSIGGGDSQAATSNWKNMYIAFVRFCIMPKPGRSA